jgi:hypothetical protein
MIYKFAKIQILVWSLILQSFIPLVVQASGPGSGSGTRTNDQHDRASQFSPPPAPPALPTPGAPPSPDDVKIGPSNIQGNNFDNKLNNRVARTYMWTDRFVSSAMTAAIIAVIGATVFRCDIKRLAYDIWPAAAAAGLLVFSDILTFKMYKGMLNINIENYDKSDSQGDKMSDQQRNALLAIRTSYEDVKTMTEIRRNFYLMASAAMAVAAAMATWSAGYIQAIVEGATIKIEALIAKMEPAAKAKITPECNAECAAGAAAAGAGQQACSQACEQARTAAAAAAAAPAKKVLICEPKVPSACEMQNADNSDEFQVPCPISSEPKALCQDNLAQPGASAPKAGEQKAEDLTKSAAVKPAVANPDTAVQGSAILALLKKTFMTVEEHQIVCREGEGFDFKKFVDSVLENFIANAYASGPEDFVNEWLREMDPKDALKKENRESSAYKAATVGGIGAGAAGIALFKFLVPQIDKFLNKFYATPLLRIVVYGVGGGILMTGVAVQTGIIAKMDQNIDEIDEVLVKGGMRREDLPPRRNNGHQPVNSLVRSLPEPLQEDIGVKDGLIIPCPGQGDGKGNCNEYPRAEDFAAMGADIGGDFANWSSELAAMANKPLNNSKNALNAASEFGRNLDPSAVSKLRNRVKLLRKDMAQKHPGAGFENLDRMEEAANRNISSMISNAMAKMGLDKESPGLASMFSGGSLGDKGQGDESKEPGFQMPKFDTGSTTAGDGASQEWNRNYNYDGPSQDSELDGLTKQKFVLEDGNKKEFISGYAEDNIFNIITIRYFKTAYPQLFEEKK